MRGFGFDLDLQVDEVVGLDFGKFYLGGLIFLKV
jgi:hypothetical protein